MGDEAVIDSAFGIENTSARPAETNLCEGTGSSDLGNLFETDPPWYAGSLGVV